MSSLRIAPLQPSPRSAVVTVVARAFWDDPLYNFFMPDLLRQHRLAPAFFARSIDDCTEWGEVHVAHLDGAIAGTAAWLPPGVMVPTGGLRALLSQAQLLALLAVASNRRRAVALLRELPRRQLPVDHWFLSTLATDPGMQGRGVGSALLEPVLARADDSSAPVFLRTQREANLAYYARIGFAVTEVIDLPESPKVWTLTRLPR